jgi:hypothetical protein
MKLRVDKIHRNAKHRFNKFLVLVKSCLASDSDSLRIVDGGILVATLLSGSRILTDYGIAQIVGSIY